MRSVSRSNEPNVRNSSRATSSAAVLSIVSTANVGRIVNLASDTALWGAPKLLAYVASKGAVVAMTKSMAAYYAPHNIRVNAIAPGFFLTDQNRSLLTAADGGLTPRLRPAAEGAEPGGRREEHGEEHREHVRNQHGRRDVVAESRDGRAFGEDGPFLAALETHQSAWSSPIWFSENPLQRYTDRP